MSRLSSATNILMEMRKLFQHPYLVAPEMNNEALSIPEQHKQLIDASGKLLFLKQLLPKLKERGHRVLLFSQFKMSLDLIEDFLLGEGYKYLRLDGDVNQLHRQKDIDKFNAHGSEYFIFLLTTRAGGVGINLASADTVIVHDPDFNPHQDLQAISRAHRYGQTKRVLVFKLMMENSAEVRIINSGKKKLVLDHLVVQQLGKEREEGEYENLLLFGAEDITKIAEDAPSTRIWTSQMVDDLIDDAEKEADEAAEAQKRLDEAKVAASQAEAEDEDASKKNGFSFAKIWEKKAKEVEAEVANTEAASPEPERDFDEHGWVQFLQQAEATEAAEREAASAVAGRLRALKKNVKYTVDLEETTPTKKKGKKGLERESQSTFEDIRDDDDIDFVPDIEILRDDAEADVPIDMEDLSTDQRTIIGGLAAGKRNLTRHERELLAKWHSLDEKMRVEALQTANALNAATPQATAPPAQPSQARSIAPAPSLAHPQPVHAIAGPGAVAGPGPSTMLFGSNRPSPPAGRRSPIVQVAEAIVRVARGQQLHMSVDATTKQVKWPSLRMVPEPQHTDNVVTGRRILHALFRVLQQSQDIGHLTDWGAMARPTTNIGQRKSIYVRLATIADDWHALRGKTRMFVMNISIAAVFYFMDSGEVIHPRVLEASQDRASQDRAFQAQFVPARYQLPAQVHPALQGGLGQQQHHSVQQPLYEQQSQQPHFSSRPLAPRNGQQHFQQVPPHQQGLATLNHAQPLPQAVPQPHFPSARPVPHGQPGHTPWRPYNLHSQPSAHFQVSPMVQPSLPPAQMPPQASPLGISEAMRRAPRASAQTPPLNSASYAQQAQRHFQSLDTPPHPPPLVIHPGLVNSLPNSPHVPLPPVTPSLPSAPPNRSLISTPQLEQPAVLNRKPSGSIDLAVPPTPPSATLAQAHTLVAPQANGTPSAPTAPFTGAAGDPTGRASNVISLSNGPAKDTGAQPLAKPNAMQLGDSSRFDSQSHRAPSESEAVDERCYWCQANHKLRNCPGLLSADAIQDYRAMIAMSDEPEEDKAEGMKALAMMEAANREKAEIERARQAKLKRPRESNGGTVANPIEIEDGGSVPPTRPASAATNKRSRNGEAAEFQGCCVCMDPNPHPLALCPVVKDGAESIRRNLLRFDPNTPTHDILTTFLRSAETGVPPGAMEPCAYCNTLCGVSVRQCAEMRGKRKDLKHKIRQIDERSLPSNEEKVRLLKGRRVTTAAWELASLDRQIAEAEKEVTRLEGVLARLYDAYNQWPNPKRES